MSVSWAAIVDLVVDVVVVGIGGSGGDDDDGIFLSRTVVHGWG